jgi:hypothetical protein
VTIVNLYPSAFENRAYPLTEIIGLKVVNVGEDSWQPKRDEPTTDRKESAPIRRVCGPG